MRQIYFGASISGGRDDVEIYRQLIHYLKKYGNVLTEHIGDRNLTHMGENLPDNEVHDRDMEWVFHATHIVNEVTTPSTGLGYEIGRRVERNLWIPKTTTVPTICLYRPREGKSLSKMIRGSGLLRVRDYANMQEAFDSIDNFFKDF